MNNVTKWTFVLLGLLLVGMQFISASSGPKSASRMRMADAIEPQVGAILDRSCQDCHSASTRWPWYSHVAPVSWMVERDVKRGRAKLDFSNWDRRHHSSNERMEICDAVSNGTMPLKVYTLIHRDARLSGDDVNRICAWADGSETEPAVDSDRKQVSAARLAHTNTQEGVR